MTATEQPLTRRINYGGGHGYELDGVKVPGITSVLRDGIPKPRLVGAAANVAGECVVNEWETLVEMKPSERGDYVRRAHNRKWYGAKVRGTDVHKLAERHLAGEEIEVPDEYAGHVDAYEKFLDDWGPAELFVERPVFSRKWQYAGTPDLCAMLNDGNTWLLDWKTGGTGIWPEAALQLAAGAHADFVLDVDGNERPLPQIDRCGCIWLRADGYDLVPVEAGKQAFNYFLWAKRVAEFTNAPRGSWVGDALQPVRRG